MSHFSRIRLTLPLFVLPVLCACGLVHPQLPFSSHPPGIYHTVKKNQTLWRICQAYGVDVQAVAEHNNISDVSQIQTGDRLFIPGAARRIDVKPAPVLSSPQATTPPPRPKLTAKKGMFSWPVRGRVIKQFGMHNGLRHDGIDIETPAGAQVRAAGYGKVIFSDHLDGYGNTIIVQHTQNYATVYANNRENLVETGQWVSRDKTIATVGTSNGRSSGHHLHFQIRRYNQPRNPLFYLP